MSGYFLNQSVLSSAINFALHPIQYFNGNKNKSSIISSNNLDESKEETNNLDNMSSVSMMHSMVKQIFDEKLLKFMHDDKCTILWHKLSIELNILYPLMITNEMRNKYKQLLIKNNKNEYIIPKYPLISLNENENKTMLNEFRKICKFAVAAYPEKDESELNGVKGVLNKKYGIDTSKMNIIIDNTTNEEANKIHEPNYYIIKENDTIYVGVCGTKSLADAYTDLDADSLYIKDIDTYVHNGIWLAAEYIYNELKNSNIFNEIKNKLIKNVIITGHSLGAGVSSLLGLYIYKMDKKLYNLTNIKIYSFASPPVVSNNEKLNVLNKYIISVSESTDIVTRMSLYSVKKMNERVEYIKNNYQSCLNKNKDNLNYLLNMQSNELNDKKLYPLGKAIWYVPKYLANLKNDNDVEIAKQKLLSINMNEFDKLLNEVPLIGNKLVNFKHASYSVMIKMLDYIPFFGNKITKYLENGSKMTKINQLLDNLHDIFYKDDEYANNTWLACDVTNLKFIFQEFEFSVESLKAHSSKRYLWALGDN